jgi:hypothetical protein
MMKKLILILLFFGFAFGVEYIKPLVKSKEGKIELKNPKIFFNYYYKAKKPYSKVNISNLNSCIQVDVLEGFDKRSYSSCNNFLIDKSISINNIKKGAKINIFSQNILFKVAFDDKILEADKFKIKNIFVDYRLGGERELHNLHITTTAPPKVGETIEIRVDEFKKDGLSFPKDGKIANQELFIKRLPASTAGYRVGFKITKAIDNIDSFSDIKDIVIQNANATLSTVKDDITKVDIDVNDSGNRIKTSIQTPKDVELTTDDNGIITQNFSLDRVSYDSFDGQFSAMPKAMLELVTVPTGESVIRFKSADKQREFQALPGSKTLIDESGDVISINRIKDRLVVIKSSSEANLSAFVKEGSRVYKLKSYDNSSKTSFRFKKKGVRNIYSDDYSTLESEFESESMFVLDARSDIDTNQISNASEVESIDTDLTNVREYVAVAPESASTFSETVTLDGERSIYLVDGEAKIIVDDEKSSMQEGVSYALPSVETDNQNYPQFINGSLQLFSGWNLISVVNSDGIKSTQIQNLIDIYSYENGMWLKPTKLENNNMGYWVKVSSDTKLNMEQNSTIFELKEDSGWVLYGAGNILNLDNFDIIQKSYVYTNPDTGWIENPTTIYPAQGFWIKQ